MYAYHSWPLLTLGSPLALVPYQIESDLPEAPAATHGNTFVLEGGSLISTGVANVFQLVLEEATDVKTWRPASVHVMCRLRPASIADPEKSVSAAPTLPA